MGGRTIKGQVSTPDNPGDSALMRWIRNHRDYAGDDCLIWPFSRSRSGYGSYGRGGKTFYVHRYICEYVHGQPPSPEHHAAHSCGRGQDGCVAPRHLSWKTNSENQLDRREHGTGRRGVLAPAQVAEIIATKDAELARVAATRFGVSETTIRQIRSGKIWRPDRRRHRFLSETEKAAVRSQLFVRPIAEIASEYGCGKTMLYKMRRAMCALSSAESTK